MYRRQLTGKPQDYYIYQPVFYLLLTGKFAKQDMEVIASPAIALFVQGAPIHREVMHRSLVHNAHGAPATKSRMVPARSTVLLVLHLVRHRGRTTVLRCSVHAVSCSPVITQVALPWSVRCMLKQA